MCIFAQSRRDGIPYSVPCHAPSAIFFFLCSRAKFVRQHARSQRNDSYDGCGIAHARPRNQESQEGRASDGN